MLVVAVLATELVLAGPTILSGVAELAQSSAGWLAVAAVAAHARRAPDDPGPDRPSDLGAPLRRDAR